MDDKVITLTNGIIIHYRHQDRWVVNEHKKVPSYFRFGDLLETDTLLDVGGHIGVVAAQASTMCRRVISVEAEDVNYDMLVHNCSQLPNVTLIKGFVSCSDDIDDNATLYVCDKDLSGHSGFIRGKKRSTSQIVERVYINDLLSMYAPNFIKLDCEGSEWYIYKDILSSCILPDVVSMEVHLGKKAWKEAYWPMLNDFIDAGYDVYAPEDLKKNWHVMVHATRRDIE